LELNHVERGWKLTRRLCTHNHYFEEVEELIDTGGGRFQIWKRTKQDSVPIMRNYLSAYVQNYKNSVDMKFGF